MRRLDRHQFDLLVLAIGYAVGAHMPHLPGWLNASMALALLVRWLQRRLRPSLGGFPIWLRLPLTLGLPLAVIATYGNLFGRDPGSALASGLVVLKLCESEAPRDARSAVTFSSFLLMAALLFDQSLVGTVLVALGLVPQVTLLRALQREDDAPPDFAAARAEFGAASLALVLALPLAIAAFLFLPRLATPLWGAPTPEQAKTGIGDDMRPGSVQELLIDDSPAFRVSFDAAPPNTAQRYWRGKVLWNYDGATWTGPAYRTLYEDPRHDLTPGRQRLGYDVTLEPTQQHKLFVLDMPTTIPPDTSLTADMTLVRDKPVSALLNYHAEAVLDYRLEGLSPLHRRAALTLPEGYNPRTLALAREWRASAHDDQEVVRDALDLFHQKFSYTLNAPLLGRDAMDDFLFDTRAGFCEHFASAFTVLMRGAGIPARVVIGYQGGYWNALGNYLVVRQSDAHAWSEIWLEGRGWVRVDPTGAVSPQRVQLGAQEANAAGKPWYGAEWLVSVRNHWDVVNRLWNEAVVRFDSLRQSGLLTPFGVKKADAQNLGLALLACALIFIAAVLWWTFRHEPETGDPLDRAWQRLCRSLARRGLRRAPSEGPRDYAARALACWPQARAELALLFDAYVALRYAQADPDAEAVAGFRRQVREFRRRGAKRLNARAN